MTGRDDSIHRLRRMVQLGIAVLAGCFAVAFLMAPGSRESLLIEDGPLESATVVVFGIALVTGIWAMRRAAHALRLFWIVPGFALFGLLDELSFGSRIFGFGLPEVDGMTVDSFHDVFDLADRVLSDTGVGRTMAAVMLLLGAGLLLAVLRATGRWQRLVGWFRARPPLLHLAGVVGLLVLAVVVDLVGSSHSARFVEETLELLAAGTVVLAGLSVAEAVTPVGSESA